MLGMMPGKAIYFDSLGKENILVEFPRFLEKYDLLPNNFTLQTYD